MLTKYRIKLLLRASLQIWMIMVSQLNLQNRVNYPKMFIFSLFLFFLFFPFRISFPFTIDDFKISLQFSFHSFYVLFLRLAKVSFVIDSWTIMVYQQTCLIILFLAPIHQMYPYGVDAGDSIITFPSRTRCFRIGREKFDTGGFPLYDRRHRKLHVSH